jgi:hypothetical protein
MQNSIKAFLVQIQKSKIRCGATPVLHNNYFYLGRAPLRREQWERLEYSHRRSNRDTRRRHKLETSEITGGETPLGYSGRIALRREQCDGFAQGLALR